MKMKTNFRLAFLAVCLCAPTVAAHAQDTTTSTTTTTTTEMSTMETSAMPSTTMMSSMPIMTMAPSATVVRRYVDMDGNISAADVRFSDGMGRGQTRQLRFAPVLMMGSEAAVAYRLGGGGMMAMSDSNLIAPPSYDPDASQDMMRGTVMAAGNTTGGMPSLGLTIEEMIAGGYKTGTK